MGHWPPPPAADDQSGGEEQDDYPRYSEPFPPFPAFPSPAPAPRRSAHPGLVALAIVACVVLVAVGVGGGVGAFRLLRRQIGAAVASRHAGTSLPSNGALDLRSLAARFDPSIVDIDGVKQDATGETVEQDAGTGLIISKDGQVLTNNHVIEGDWQLKATLKNGMTYPLQVVGEDPTDDVALVQIQGASGLPAVNLGSGAIAQVDESVAAFGNALGRGGTPTASQGQVTNVAQTITATLDDGSDQSELLSGLIEMSAQICPGDSGGVLANAEGQYLGILTAASASNNQGTPGSGAGNSGGNGGTSDQNGCSGDGFAIPVGHAAAIVRRIQSGRRSAKVIVGVPGFLGVEVQECTDASSQQGSCQPPAVNGAEITQLVAGGAAQQAGLPATTFIITAVDQTPVTGPDDLTTALDQTTPGQVVQITWNAGPGGVSRTTPVTLAAGPPA